MTVDYPSTEYRVWHTPVPAAWEEARKAVEEKAGHPVILAGGALLNNLLGLPVNDLDMFIMGIPLVEALSRFNLDAQAVQTYGGLEFVKHAHMEFAGQDCDLIFLHGRERDPIWDFDLDICQISWDGEKFEYSNAFIEALYTKKFHTVGGFLSDHLNRVKAKLAPLGFEHVQEDLDDEIPF